MFRDRKKAVLKGLAQPWLLFGRALDGGLQLL